MPSLLMFGRHSLRTLAFRPVPWSIAMSSWAKTNGRNESSAYRNGFPAGRHVPTPRLVQGVGAVSGTPSRKAEQKCLRTESFHHPSMGYGPKDPTRRVGAWAGATPVWAPLARPDLLAGRRRSEVAPAHACPGLNRVNLRKKEHLKCRRTYRSK